MTTATPALFGLRIEVSRFLAGSKVAFQIGDGPVYVSPAMYDLISHASPTELESLLRSICIRRLPAMPSFREPLPMATSWAPKGAEETGE